ncbi:hypothetical protein BY458DRAFT_495518 [Sporodiniella umbellata]|nr:hypothetical protein BY458DRAFT_495518 [Sporodiniella umbellata]
MFVDQSNPLHRPKFNSAHQSSFRLEPLKVQPLRLPGIHQLHTPKVLKKNKLTHRVLLPMKCQSCQSSETPEWRKGPLGPRTLCNACGLIWTKLRKQEKEKKKEENRPALNKHTLSFLLS